MSGRARILRSTLPLAAIVLSSLSACHRAPPSGPAQRVIVITCDTLRADRLGAYGYARPTSPNVDAFATDATLFEHAWSTAPMTTPALGSLFTSRMPHEIGLTSGNLSLLPPEVLTLPEILAREGVETAAVVSNWVLRRPRAGQTDAGLHQGFARYDDEMGTKELHRDYFDRNAEDTTDAAIAWLSSRRDQRSSPFFLWVHYQDPHGPYVPPPRWAQLFETPKGASRPEPAPGIPAEQPPELPIGRTQSGLGQIPAYQAVEGQRSPRSYADRYDAEIRAFDEGFGRLVRWLKENALYEDSLILFAADHGESLGEHGFWFCHGENTWAEELRIPLVVRCPGKTPGGRRTEVASLLDVQPTVLEALGLAPVPSRGVSLLSADLPRDRVVPQVRMRDGDPSRWSAVTGERFRVVVEGSSPPRLFDFLGDPAEAHDLSASAPVQLQDLLDRGQAFLDVDVGPPVMRRIVRPDLGSGTQTNEGLKRLGYVEGEDPH